MRWGIEWNSATRGLILIHDFTCCSHAALPHCARSDGWCCDGETRTYSEKKKDWNWVIVSEVLYSKRTFFLDWMPVGRRTWSLLAVSVFAVLLVVNTIIGIRHVPVKHHVVQVFVLILNALMSTANPVVLTFISISCGRFILIILTAWNTSTSWSMSIWSMQMLAPMYTPTRETPLLQIEYRLLDIRNSSHCDMTMVGLVSGRSGALFRQLLAILITSMRPVVDSGTLFSIGHILTWTSF